MDQNESVIRIKPFSKYLASRVFSTLAYQMLAVAVGWHIYSLTGSAFYLGLVGLAQFLPMFLLTLIVGHVVDRFNRKAIVGICQIVQAAGTALLAVGSLSGWLTKESILIIVFILGAAKAFEGPASQALMPGLVPEKLFPKAAAWGSSAFQTASILGPALGGILYALKPSTVYITCTVLLCGASAFISLIPLVKKVQHKAPISLESIFAGIHYIRSKPVILGAISLDLFAVLLGGATALLPAYAKDILFTGPWGLGVLRSAPAIGALIISAWLARYPLKKNVGRIMFTAVALFGVATLVFALSRSFILSLASLIFLGGADVISVVIRSSLVQLETPDNMRGRVSAVNSMFIGTSNQLGEFESGLTAAWFGIIPAALIGGAGTIIVVLLWIKFFPALLKANTLTQAK